MAQRRPRDAETPEMQTLAERNIARDYAVQYNGPVIRTVNIYRLDQDGCPYTRALRLQNPEVIKSLIERDNFEDHQVPRETYRWVLDNRDYKKWRAGEGGNLLWVKGEKGIGKTTLFCGIIDDLCNQASCDVLHVAYYFCHPPAPGIQACEALYTLIHNLASWLPQLRGYLEESDELNNNTPRDVTACNVLGKTLKKMLDHLSSELDGRPGVIYLAIDAIDECGESFGKLLLSEIQASWSWIKSHTRLRWLVTSCSQSKVGDGIRWKADPRILDLQHYSDELSNSARAYILDRVLREQRRNVGEECQRILDQHRAEDRGPFLRFVETGAKSLQNTLTSEAESMALEAVVWLCKLAVNHPTTAGPKQTEKIVGLYRNTASMVRVAYRNLLEEELDALSLVDSSKDQAVDARITRSFVSIERGEVKAVHGLAKDFFRRKGALFTLGMKDEHHRMFLSCLAVMKKALTCSVPGASYACEYWIKHLIAGQFGPDAVEWKDKSSYHQTPSHIYSFAISAKTHNYVDALVEFFKESFLDWIQYIAGSGKGLLYKMFSWWPSLMDLVNDLHDPSELKQLVADAHRFMAQCGPVIVKFPHQVRTIALIFTPQESRARLFPGKWNRGPKITASIPSRMEQPKWSQWLRTLDEREQLGSKGARTTMVFSFDGTRLATATDRGDVKVWDVERGQCRMTVRIREGTRCLWFAFVPRQTQLAVATVAKTLRSDGGPTAPRIFFWDTESREEDVERRMDCVGRFSAAAFSPDGTKLAMGNEEEISIISVGNQDPRGVSRICHRYDTPHAIVYSPSGTEIASAHWSGVCVWNLGPNGLKRVAVSRVRARSLVAFVAPSGQRLAVAHSASLQTGDIRTALSPLQKINFDYSFLDPIALSAGGNRLAVASRGEIQLWDVAAMSRVRAFKGLDPGFGSLALSPDGNRLASASASGLKIWDASGSVHGSCIEAEASRDHEEEISAIVVSADGSRMVSVSADAVQVWNPLTGEKWPISIGGGAVAGARYVAISPNGKLVALCPANSDGVQVWDLEMLEKAETPEKPQEIPRMALTTPSFSPDGKRIAIMTASRALSVCVWSRDDRGLFADEERFDICTPPPEDRFDPGCVACAESGEHLVLAASLGSTITVWSKMPPASQQFLGPLGESGHVIKALCFSPCSTWVAASFGGTEIVVWSREANRPHQHATLHLDKKGVDLIALVEAKSNIFRFKTNTGIVCFDRIQGTWQRRREGYGINLEGGWIMDGNPDRNVLQLPPDYHPSRATVVSSGSGNAFRVSAVVLGTYSGRVISLSFPTGNPQLSTVGGSVGCASASSSARPGHMAPC